MRLGLHIVRFPWPGGPSQIGPGLIRVAERAEAVGASGLSFMDHHRCPPGRGSPDGPMIEGYTSLAFLAGLTSSVRLRLLVTGVTYRHPGLLVKIVTTLDVLSGGRAELGLGAAWYGLEHAALGIPFPSVSERFQRLEETLQICLQTWGPNNAPFQGRHFQLADTLCSPRPLSQPRPRILVGGEGVNKTLSLVARYADACNLAATSPAAVRHKLDVLKRHCDHFGRSYDEIAKTIVYRGDALTAGRHRRFVALMSEYASLNVDEVFVLPAGQRPEDWIDAHCGPVIPELAALGPG